MAYSIEQRFKALCQITRASHFEWRRAFMEMNPGRDPKDAVLKYWEVVGHDTAKAYLKQIDRSKAILPQLCQCIVESSLSMGENASFEKKGAHELILTHAACPWYAWHKRYDALSEDQPGCDKWLETIVHAVNKALGTRIEYETLCSLPGGADSCKRRVTEKR